ncbi:MAG: type II 3-dehydroquinate dehydratase [Bacteroidetes bacterium]|nr:type II 3-dehydroquinate dehydratase [Bacteroidota bacterium]
MKIIIINGPNLNLLGTREPLVYGNQTFDEYFESLKPVFPGIELEYFQSNIEGELINKLHDCGFSYDGIVLNAGGYTHTSVAIGDAIKSITTPVVEVHISNIHAREEFRLKSMISAGVMGIIVGFGIDVYRMAVEKLIRESGQRI